ncbi:MAG: hypothetical protein WA071_04390 [Undibacterium umbellatum]|uniref:hypothetical protein n=1 Tax=Undibacterium umbellatum TaxID=2762300 RepID=UPI003BB71536
MSQLSYFSCNKFEYDNKCLSMVFGKSKGEKLLAIIICRSTAGAARIKKPAGKSGPGHLAESGPQKRRKGRIILGLGILDKQDFAFFCRKFLEPALRLSTLTGRCHGYAGFAWFLGSFA